MLGRNATLIVLTAGSLAATQVARADADPSATLATGKATLSFRVRHEYVDQEGASNTANALTLRPRFTWTSAAYGNWTYGLEADYVTPIGNERFNSTTNGETSFPVVADPEGFDLNQAYVRYKHDALTLTAGRQRVLHADQRFVGGVGWRQNEQTYDALRAEYSLGDKFAVDYGYAWNVNRIFGPDGGAQPSDWHGNVHMVTAKYVPAASQTLEAFSYLLEFDNANGVPNSTATYGVTYRATIASIGVHGTLATQTDFGESPLDYRAPFYAIGASTDFSGVTVKLGLDILGSDGGTAAFRTPLATLHKFQGWADKFLATPADGIEDLHVGVAFPIGKLKVAATVHDFRAEASSRDLGSELDVVATLPVSGGNVQFKLAHYAADDHATDTTKAWLTFNYSL